MTKQESSEMNGVNFLKNIGLGHWVTIGTILVTITVSNIRLEGRIQLLEVAMENHVTNEFTHLMNGEKFWIEYTRDNGFTWQPHEKEQFLREWYKLRDSFESGVSEGRFQHPAEKRKMMEEICDEMFEKKMKEYNKKNGNNR